ncbi:RHS repeat-associated core domain-containing protein [Acidovorax sp. LjRoot118]|uniref:RHS repeat-associated core domain-containing protein n=1 Tax=Acidovorax sp. LjRoot118 TaxID=3342256 RepID=UPI003F508B9B
MARRARCDRVHSATVNRPTGVSGGPTLCLRLRSRWVTLAWSTAGSTVWHYNYFRSYSAERGRYTQADPIGLDGGFNRFGYVEGNLMSLTVPLGLSASGPDGSDEGFSSTDFCGYKEE